MFDFSHCETLVDVITLEVPWDLLRMGSSELLWQRLAKLVVSSFTIWSLLNVRWMLHVLAHRRYHISFRRTLYWRFFILSQGRRYQAPIVLFISYDMLNHFEVVGVSWICKLPSGLERSHVLRLFYLHCLIRVLARRWVLLLEAFRIAKPFVHFRADLRKYSERCWEVFSCVLR